VPVGPPRQPGAGQPASRRDTHRPDTRRADRWLTAASRASRGRARWPLPLGRPTSSSPTVGA